jgi:hypothetical protein
MSTYTGESNQILGIPKHPENKSSRRALAGSEKVLGVEHPSTLTSVTNLALGLEKVGAYFRITETLVIAAKKYKPRMVGMSIEYLPPFKPV